MGNWLKVVSSFTSNRSKVTLLLFKSNLPTTAFKHANADTHSYYRNLFHILVHYKTGYLAPIEIWYGIFLFSSAIDIPFFLL